MEISKLCKTRRGEIQDAKNNAQYKMYFTKKQGDKEVVIQLQSRLLRTR